MGSSDDPKRAEEHNVVSWRPMASSYEIIQHNIIARV